MTGIPPENWGGVVFSSSLVKIKGNISEDRGTYNNNRQSSLCSGGNEVGHDMTFLIAVKVHVLQCIGIGIGMGCTCSEVGEVIYFWSLTIPFSA